MNAPQNYLSKCIYNENNDPYCPIFRLNDILLSAETDEYERYQMLLKVNQINIRI